MTLLYWQGFTLTFLLMFLKPFQGDIRLNLETFSATAFLESYILMKSIFYIIFYPQNLWKVFVMKQCLK